MIHVRFRIYRGKPSLRARGAHPTTGEALDTTTPIPPSVFIETGVPAAPRTAREKERWQQVVSAFALAEERRLNAPPEIGSADAPRAAEMTFRELWALFERRNPSQAKASTLRRNKSMARNIIAFFDDNPDATLRATPSKVSLGLLEEYREHRKRQGASPATIFDELGFVRQLVQFGLDRSNETGVRAMSFAKLPVVLHRRSGGKAKRFVTPDQFFRIYEATGQLPRRGDTMRRILGVAITTRLRRFPLLNFRLEWLNRERQWLRVPSTFMKGRLENYAELSIAVPQWTVSLLAELPASGLAFPSQIGRQYGSDDLPALLDAAEAISEEAALAVILLYRYRVCAADIATLKRDQIDVNTGALRGLRGRRTASTTIASTDRSRLLARSDEPHILPGLRTERHVRALLADVHRLAGRDAEDDHAMSNIDRTLYKLADLAGEPRVGLHRFRASGNTWLMDHTCKDHPSPVEESIREALMGHTPKGMRITYEHVTEAMMRRAVGVYDCILKTYSPSMPANVIDFSGRKVS